MKPSPPSARARSAEGGSAGMSATARSRSGTPGRAPQLPQDIRAAGAAARRAHRLGGRLDERDRGIDERMASAGSPVQAGALRRERATSRDPRPRPLGIRDPVPQRERAPVVARGLGERSDALGLVARAHRGGQRARLVAGSQPVVRDLGRDGRRVAAGEVGPRLQRGGERRVQPRPLARQQLVVGDLLQQGMAEGEAVAARDEHVMAHRLAQRVGELRLREPGRRREQPWCTSRPPAAATRTTACAHRIERARCGPAACRAASAAARRPRPRRRHELLGEERVALRAGEHRVDERLGRSAPRIPASCSRISARASGVELQPLRARRGRHIGQEAPQALAAVDLVAAVRRHDQDALVAQPARQEGQQVERRPIGPMEVLDDEQHRRDAAAAARRSRTSG